MAKAKKTVKSKTRQKVELPDEIQIDAKKDLVFKNEKEVQQYFGEALKYFEKEFESRVPPKDIPLKEFPDYEKELKELLMNPDEVWESRDLFPQWSIHTFFKKFQNSKETFYYLAVAYTSDGRPTFLFLHFPTRIFDFANSFRKGRMVYDRNIQEAQEREVLGDALQDQDPMAVGLYEAMLKLRSPADISEAEFSDFLKFRERTLDQPDEIYRNQDTQGHVFVTFVRHFTEDDRSFTYIIVTAEEEVSESNYMLFSFPTRDPNLIDRYRHGDRLSSDEFVREESH